MKKFLLTFIFIIIISFLHAEEYSIYSGKGYNINKTSKLGKITDFAIKYDNSENTYYLYTSDSNTSAWIFISKEQLDVIRKNLSKYIEWEMLAVKNKANIEKDLPDSTITTHVFWKYKDNWYSADSLVLSFVFLSQSVSRHQFCIASNIVGTTSDETIKFRLNTLYLDKDHVKSFINGISEKAVEKAWKDKKIKNNKENLFQ